MYGWFYYEKEGHYQGPYPSKEDAVAAGRAMTPPGRNFWIVEGKKPPFAFPDADQLLALFVAANGRLGTAEKPFGLEDVEITPEQKAHLEVAFRDLFGGWMEQYQINFNIDAFRILRNTERIEASGFDNAAGSN